MTIKLTGHIEVGLDDLEVVRAHLPEHVRLTRQEPGCLGFQVKQRIDAPHIFDVDEEFADRAAFDAHQQRVKHSAWGDVTRHVQRHYQITED